VTSSGSFACLQIHFHENVLHRSSKCYSQGLRLRQLDPALPDKSILEAHNREYSKPERSGSCMGGSEDRCEELFARTWELFQEWLRVARQIGAHFSQTPLEPSQCSLEFAQFLLLPLFLDVDPLTSKLATHAFIAWFDGTGRLRGTLN